MDTQTIQLEAFSTSLHGAKILYSLPSQSQQPQQQHPPWSEWIQRLRQPFRKTICVTSRLLPFVSAITPRYDAVFQAKDSADWTLILTYLTYAPKPLLAIVEDIAIPDGLWQKLTTATTLIHITHQPIVRLHPYDAIFFSPMEEVNTTYSEEAHRILQAVYKPSYSLKEHREILQELRVAKAGMAWTRIEETTQGVVRGAIYWYDPVPTQADSRLAPSDLAELFQWLSDTYKSQA